MFNLDDLIIFLNDIYFVDIKNKKYYLMAFTHSSYINEHNNLKKNEHYERLEFLGDATLELAVSEFLFKKFPDLPEGELTKIRASLVCEVSLVKYAKLLNFDKYILLGKGEEKTGGRQRGALLADIFESFIGALYLDKGFEFVYKFLEKTLFNEVKEDNYVFKDYKTILQEYSDSKKLGEVKYLLVESKGPAHDRIFNSCVTINKKEFGLGVGKTKKESEQFAAKEALSKLNYFEEK